MLNQDQFICLLRNYLNGELQKRDKDLLLREVASGRYDPELKRIIDAELAKQHALGDPVPPHIADEIYRNIVCREAVVQRYSRPSVSRIPWLGWAAAAMLILSLSIPLFFGLHREKDQMSENFPVKGLGSLKEYRNNTDKNVSLSLPDGTVIDLYPQATVRYSVEHSTERSVLLEGDAFFRVTKDPSRPFHVLCNEIVTKVLGTSFEIRGSNKKRVEVTVRSGKVQVYHKDREAASVNDGRIAIIRPNHRLFYEAGSDVFELMLAEEILPLIPEEKSAPAVPRLKYALPVSLQTIADEIGEVYGVQIMAEHPGLYKCLLSGDLSRANLYEKLDMICLSLNASYEVNGTVILIKGKGCAIEGPNNGKTQLSYINQNKNELP